MLEAWFSQDITFCAKFYCENKDCLRNCIHIIDGALPHSFAKFENTDECPLSKRKE